MQLITLNIWGGHLRDPLLDFIGSHRDIDIFCLQEVYHNASKKISNDDKKVHLNIFSDLKALLPEHHALFCPAIDNYGIAMFLRKDIDLITDGILDIYHNPHHPGSGPSHSRTLQWLKCLIDSQAYCILNVHGLWNGKGKADCPERILQSQKIREFLTTVESPKILCGDFNLRPDTESIKILEEGMNNLIQMYKVDTTRTRHYGKEEKFADYIFTSPEIVVNRFEVLNDEVSDHAPLLLDFCVSAS
jgi:endonuclease/exonuclease/phosphatase family metal-dependent hydrolase